MAKPPKKIGEGEFRFDCECKRIHIFSTDGDKMKVETIEPNKPKEANDTPEDQSVTPTPRKKTGGFLDFLN